nr:Enterobactin synthase component F [Klebsiella pneumoniae]
MQFSNPSTIRKGSFTFCAMINSSTACGRRTATCLPAGRWCAPQSAEACNARLAANWSTLTPPIMRHKELTMTTRLPLVAAQPGIWMAERLSTLPGAGRSPLC